MNAEYKLLPQGCRLLESVLPPYGTSFAALWHKFCHFTAQVFFPPYDGIFAVLWCPVLINRAQWSGGVEVYPRTA